MADSLIVNPSLDGYVMSDDTSQTLTWAQVVGGTGTNNQHGGNTATSLIWCSQSTSGKWRACYRPILLFNTAALPDDATITSATLQLYGVNKNDVQGWAPDICLYSVNPASTEDLANSDYSTFGNAAFSDVITYASFTASAWNTFTLNAAGLAAISKTGITKFGIRNANYEVAEELDPGNHTPAPWGANKDSYLTFDTVETTGFEPILTINYTTTELSSGGGVGKVRNNFRRF